MQTQIPFQPAWWLPGPHLQTVWAAQVHPKTDYVLRRERLELPDGDFLDLDWLDKPGAPRVLLVHGLNGGIDAPYMERMLQAIKNQGWCAIVLHLRGCSGEPNRLMRSYHAGETGDLQTVVTTLQQRDPQLPLSIVGYSLGGNMLLKWLGETKANNPVSAAVAVSVPFELHKAATTLSKGYSRFYQWWLLNGLRQFVINKFKNTPAPFDLSELKNLKTFWEFDNKVTAPLHGFKDAQDYYRQSSSRPYLKLIQKPTLIVHAKDDPFMTPDVVPYAHELSSHIYLELTESGGHVGFVSGNTLGRPVYWLEFRIIEYLQTLLD